MSFILKHREHSEAAFQELHAEELEKIAGGAAQQKASMNTYTTGDKDGDGNMDFDGSDD
ncbi:MULTISPECIES: hypothetical protein [unclassified Pseudoalteromonas]|uniref:hypothetical protein n=1 Tax=unclassified Pseudoalteromonas TaxID=194690 RepID=UPI00301421AA